MSHTTKKRRNDYVKGSAAGRKERTGQPGDSSAKNTRADEGRRMWKSLMGLSAVQPDNCLPYYWLQAQGLLA